MTDAVRDALAAFAVALCKGEGQKPVVEAGVHLCRTLGDNDGQAELQAIVDGLEDEKVEEKPVEHDAPSSDPLGLND